MSKHAQSTGGVSRAWQIYWIYQPSIIFIDRRGDGRPRKGQRRSTYVVVVANRQQPQQQQEGGGGRG